MIRSKFDAACLIPRPTMGHTSQRIACLGWTITRTCMDLRLRTADGVRLVDDAELTNMIYANRKRINDDLRLAAN